MENQLWNASFPRSNRYAPDWITASVSGGANPLWLTEWLTSEMPLQAGMRVLDLGCGRALSSIFLHREFQVEVWATDLWFSASENLQRIRDANCDERVFPIRADARQLPYADGFFDAIVSIDSFMYYGTDDLFLNTLARLLKPGGWLGIAMAGLMREFHDAVPAELSAWWEPSEMACLHSSHWWHKQWQRSGLIDVKIADDMPNGWKHWLQWQQTICPENRVELEAVAADQGRSLGYIRCVGSLRPNASFEQPIPSVPTLRG
jgi:cyclopropane fatty-acyl-phospholipid synthase-like methyltransferase